MGLDRIHLPTLYARAREGFAQSAGQSPALSVEELGMSWGSIGTQENSVSVRFSGLDSKSYVVETKLDLISTESEVIGWYSLLEDENENVVDDYLVFT